MQVLPRQVPLSQYSAVQGPEFEIPSPHPPLLTQFPVEISQHPPPEQLLVNTHCAFWQVSVVQAKLSLHWVQFGVPQEQEDGWQEPWLQYLLQVTEEFG